MSIPLNSKWPSVKGNHFFLWVCFLMLLSPALQAQMNLPDTSDKSNFGSKLKDIMRDDDPQAYPNKIAGEFTPGKGFQIIKSKFGSLNISIYGMARWVDQMPGEATWSDHRDSIRVFEGRNDIYWHRAMIWLTGYLGTPKLTYMLAVWTVTTTQQTLVFGNVVYRFNKYISAGIGMTPNVCIRSVQGAFPLFSSTDRTMAEDGLRGGIYEWHICHGGIIS
jgi:hypothetical protein